MLLPLLNMFVSEKDKSVCSQSDSDDSDDSDGLANEVAMLAERIRRRSFGRYKGKGKSTQADKPKKSFDMAKVTCYKCGKIGHMANDCRSKTSGQADTSKNSKNDKYSKLRAKYKTLKAQVAKLSEKSLVAKDWAESDTSSDDEVFEDARCMMAREEKFIQDIARVQEQTVSAQATSTSQSVSE